METNKLNRLAASDPVLVLFLGIFPAIAVTDDVRAALAAAGITFLILVLSSIFAALLGRFLTAGSKVAVYMLLNTALAVSAQIVLQALSSEIHGMVGIYAALLAITLSIPNCFVDGKSSFARVLLRAVLSGICLAALLCVSAAIREVFGNASFMGLKIDALAGFKISILTKAPGGFGVLAVLSAVICAICNHVSSGSNAARTAAKTEEV
ncbi:MAG: hypothetical protein MJ135_06075 [Oscillospiraceae bacterium]|nr:hypothetical protein [Oscillospiraceae bacterium]